MLILISLLLLAFLMSFLFSGSETGFVSWNSLKVSHAATQGNLNARIAMRLLGGRSQMLSAILVGGNIANIGTALIFAEVYVRVDQMVAADLSRLPSPESWFLTPFMLLFCEMLPKSLYRTYPFKLTMKSVPFLAVFYYVLSPIFLLFRAASKIFGRGDNDLDHSNVRESIVQIANEGAKRGNIFASADNIMKNTLDMKGKKVSDFMISLDEWRKSHVVYKASQFVSEFRAGVSGRSGDIIIFDDVQGTQNAPLPIGYVPLLSVAECRANGGGETKTFSNFVRPLSRLKAGMDVLPCLRRMSADSRFYLVVDDNKPVGLLDKMVLYEMAFS